METTAATPEAPKAPKRLSMKLSEVMAEVGRIPKNGYNSNHNYRYAKEDDVLEGVRNALSSRALILMPSVEDTAWSVLEAKSGSKQRICTLTVRFTLHDGETGEHMSFTVLGEGQDVGDKATYKAMTGALKYALLKLFLIPTGDDPENEPKEERSSGNRSAPRSQAARSARPAPAPQAAQPPPPPAPSPAANTPTQTAAQLRKLRINRIFHELQAVRGLRTEQCRSWASPTVADKPSAAWDDQELTELERRLKEEP